MSEEANTGLYLVLSKPIVIGGATYSEVTMREPTVGDLRILTSKQAQTDPITASNQLYSQLTDAQVPAEAFDRMLVRDMRKITQWFRPFTEEETF